ncbi:MAG: hypothetical protein QXQ28_02535 [Candidatus Nezhaarchaeales archaeon]
MSCPLCGSFRPEYLCIRCRRSVCANCWDKQWQLCKECAQWKWAILEDRHRQLNILVQHAKVAKELVRKGCDSCVILRELFLSYLKWLKELELEAERERFNEVKERIPQLRRMVTEVTLRALVKQGLSVGEAWE